MQSNLLWTVAVATCLCLLTPALNAKEGSLDGFDGQTSFTSSKEKPGLDPVLSETIAEDIKKNIESRRLVEDAESRLRPREARQNNGGDPNGFVLTTARSTSKASDPASNKQTSRIQIKKGPNGVDYEYEYVYYYYDEDEDEVAPKSSAAKTENNVDNRGKNRYTTIDRNSAEAEVSGRSSSVQVEEVPVEERLPQITRFPPRAITESTQIVDDVKQQPQLQQQKIRRPGLDLVDSHSFNTDDKQNKAGRTTSTEKDSGVGSVSAKDAYDIIAASDSSASGLETTTSTMEKAAFDLYVILQNENLNRDLTTELPLAVEVSTLDSEEVVTDDALTTTERPETTTSTTTTTTTPRPTTTTTKRTTTTTTTSTTTTESPVVESRRGGSVTAGRNSLRFRSQNRFGASSTEAPTEATPTRSRFARPSSGTYTGRGRTTAAPTSVVTVEVDEEATKPVTASSFGNRPSKTHNRFNLRGQTTTKKAIEAVESNAIDSVPSTTARSLRTRPSFSVRPRGRQPATTAAPAEVVEDVEDKVEENAKVIAPVSVPKPALGGRTRVNAGRPNPLLAPRGRSNVLGRGTTTTTTAPEPAAEVAGDEDLQETDVPLENNEKTEEAEKQSVPEVTTPATGLNRLKNRARLQVHKPEKPKSQPVVVNRRANPLIARRNLFSSTTEAPTEEASEEQQEKTEDTNEETEKVEEVSEPVSVAPSEAPRGLGLLGNRRRPLLRRPGTLTHQ